MKKLVCLFTSLSLVLVLILVGCSNQQSEASDSGKIQITFWHTEGGDLVKTLQEITDDFNKQSDSVHVRLVFQGSYDEIKNKFSTVAGSSAAPAVLMGEDNKSKFMAHSGAITPIYKFIKNDPNFDMSHMEKNIYAHYELNGKLYSMPFSASNTVMYYNKDMFKKAGLDPDHPPKTFKEMTEASKKLKEKGGADYGFAMPTLSWFVNQLLSNQNALAVNANNGHSGDSTKSLMNKKAGLKIFNWLSDMKKEGLLKNYGRTWDGARSAFLSKQVGMIFDSSANTTRAVDSAPFEVGLAYLPVAEGMKRQGVSVGGNSLWITNSVSKKKQKAAWEYVKFLANAQSQAKWAAATGYLPVTSKSYNEKVLKKIYKKYPQMKVTTEQMHSTKLSAATKGVMIENYPPVENIIGTALENVYQGKDPKKVVNSAARKIDQSLNTPGG